MNRSDHIRILFLFFMQMNVSAVTDRHDSQYDRAKNGPSIKKSVEFYKNWAPLFYLLPTSWDIEKIEEYKEPIYILNILEYS